MSKKRKLPLIAVGTAVVGATAVVLVLGWRELAVRYWINQCGDVPYIDFDLLSEPRDSVRWEALQRYVRTPAGKDKLLRTYIPVADDAVMVLWHKLKQLGPDGNSVFLLVWVDEQARLREFVFSKARAGKAIDRGPTATGISPEGSYGRPPVSLVHPLQELLLHAGYDRYPVPEDLRSPSGILGIPGVRFSVVSLGTPDERSTRDLGRSPRGRLGPASHACLFEREGWDFLETPMQ